MPLITWTAEPDVLRDPVLLIALEGFIDAGSAATTAAMFLRHRWRAEEAATFDADALVDYRARRPTVLIDEGELRRVDWPGIELLTAVTGGPRDVVFLLGAEPDAAWGAFNATVVEACRALGVTDALGLGAYPAAVPHTREVRLVQASTHPGRGPTFDAAPVTGYTGPVGAGIALQEALGRAGIPAVGLWAEVPHYIAASPNPEAALAIVRVVADGLGVEVDTTELQAAADLHREQVDEAISDHVEAAGMVAALEAHVDGVEDGEMPSGDELAAEIERYLRTETD